MHGGAEVAGAGQHRGGAHAHDSGHHATDRSGHPGGIGVDAGQILIDPPLGIPFKAFQQRLGQGAGDVETLNGAGKGAISWIIDRLAAIGAVKSVAQAGEGDLMIVGIVVDGIVGQAAESVEGRGRFAQPLGQEKGRCIERLGTVAQEFPAGEQVGWVGKVGITNEQRHRGPPYRARARRK